MVNRKSKIKRVIIKEELFAITQKTYDAIVLGQFIYWLDKTKDFDEYIKEEKERGKASGQKIDFPLTNGWIYKKADDIINECMLDISKATAMRVVDRLLESGYLNQRVNPRYSFDKVYQYRVDIIKICADIKSLGYSIDEYEYLFQNQNESPMFQNETTGFQNETTGFQNETAIPYITSEITLHNKKKEDKSSLKKGARKQNECEWRKHYEAYKQLVLSAKDQLLNDHQAKQNLLFMYPNADYYRTVLKSVEFWCSEKGWEYKKKSTAKDINMLSTLKNNLNKNIVYRNVNDQPIENLQKLNISVNEQGICADGTFIRGAYRYYHSMRDNKDYSIPIQALPMPNERCEFNMKTQSWYLPYENENTDDLLW